MFAMPDAEIPSSSENKDATPGEPTRPASAAPRIRIQRGATVYAPWRRADERPPAPQSGAPQRVEPANAPAPTPAAPPLNFATPAVAPTVIIRPAPGSQHWVADEFGSEPTIEMTVEFAAVMGDEATEPLASDSPETAMEAVEASVAPEASVMPETPSTTVDIVDIPVTALAPITPVAVEIAPSITPLQSITETLPAQGIMEAIPLLDPAAFLTRPTPAPVPVELSLISPVPLVASVTETLSTNIRDNVTALDAAEFLARPTPAPVPVELSLISPVPIVPSVTETLPLSTSIGDTVALLDATEFLARPTPSVELLLIAPVSPTPIVSEILTLTDAIRESVPLLDAATALVRPEPTPAPVELPLIALIPQTEGVIGILPVSASVRETVAPLDAAEFLSRPTPPVELPLIAPAPVMSMFAEPLPLPIVPQAEIPPVDMEAFWASVSSDSALVESSIAPIGAQSVEQASVDAQAVIPEAVEAITLPTSPVLEEPLSADTDVQVPEIVQEDETPISVLPVGTVAVIREDELPPVSVPIQARQTEKAEEPQSIPVHLSLQKETPSVQKESAETKGAELTPPPRRLPTPLSPALPGIARFLAVAGIIIATLGALVRPLSEMKSPALDSLAGFVNAVESDSRIQTRNLQRRAAGAALSPGLRKKARVVVVLAEARRGAAPDEYPIGRLELASLIRLCHAAEVPVIGLAADTGKMPLTSGIPAAGPLPGTTSDPLAVAIQEVSNASLQANPTFVVLPAIFDPKAASAGTAKSPSASGWTLTDPQLPRDSAVTGFIGPSPVAPDAVGDRGALRRTLALTASISLPDNQGGGVAQAISMPGALALLAMPGVAQWPQANGMEFADSVILKKLVSAFGYPPPVIETEVVGNHPVAIDFGLLQSDPEGVQVVSEAYVRKLDDDQRRILLQNRPVVIGLDRKIDRIQTPLSSPRFVFLQSVKPTMALAEAEGRATAMLLAHAEQKSESAGGAGVAPPFPYQEAFPNVASSIIWVAPALVLGYLLGLTGRRIAARPLRLGVDDAPLTPDEKSKLLWRRIMPPIMGIALAGTLGALWRIYATPGFMEYQNHPGFSPWAASWFAAAASAAVFGLASLILWMLGIVWGGRGVAIIIVATIFTFGVLIVQDFALFPVWTPLLAPVGGLLLGASLTIGRQQSARYKYQQTNPE